jgi:hypothetical protein
MDYSDILETPEQIQARLLKHKILDEQNKKLCESYREEWKQRTFMTKQYKPYWHKKQINNDDIQFLDDD